MKMRVPRKILKALRNYNAEMQDIEQKNEFSRLFCSEYYKLEKCCMDISCTQKVYAALSVQIVERGFTLSTDGYINLIKEINNNDFLSNEEYYSTLDVIRVLSIEEIYMNISDGIFDISRLNYSISNINLCNEIDLDALSSQLLRLEQLLHNDPTGVYADQTIKTKASYRNMICRIAKKKHTNELLIAESIINSAINTNSHIGFALYELYNKVFDKKFYQIMYYSLPAVFAVMSCTFFILFTKYNYTLVLSIIPFCEIYRTIIGRYILKVIPQIYAPRLQLKNKIPAKFKTCIVLATLMPRKIQMTDLYEKLERNILMNGQQFVIFVVLIDFGENDNKVNQLDQESIFSINFVIDKLNSKYDNCVVLLVREREYSYTQRKFIGANRKFGAITQFIQQINGGNVKYMHTRGDMKNLLSIKYIFTIDYDTVLLMDTIAEYVEIAIHPLNTPIIDKNKRVVVSGYGIINPSSTLDLRASQQNKFMEIVGGIGGTNNYNSPQCELNQHLFDNSVFTGKGLIDVEAYNEIIIGKMENETVLSHDIIEGIYLRTRFVSDLEVIDAFPTTTTGYFKRLHRWIRGDFQNSFFLSCKNVTFQSKIKILSNLISEIFLAFAFLLMLNPNQILAFLGAATVLIPYIYTTIVNIFLGPITYLTTSKFSNTISSTITTLLRGIFELAFTPTYAYISLDAAIRGIYRRYISKKHLLEWVTAFQTQNEKSSIASLVIFYGFNLIAAAISLLHQRYLFAFIFLSAYIFVIISYKDTTKSSSKIGKLQFDKLRRDVEKMGNYYLENLSIKNNFLPPDNIQYAPVYRIAERTSPTNIGMMFLSLLSMADLGIISHSMLHKSIDNTVTTVERLEKYHGNLYNWYNTVTLEILPNYFVSTVDSGNFVCCLVALRQGLCEFFTENDSLIMRISELINATDLSMFYNKNKNLFSIGYDTEAKELSKSHYDMLMSEARMTSYFAVASGYAPKEHWSALGRTLSRQDVHTGAISWTGTMFEYFMPELLLHSEPGSLAYESLMYCIFCQKNRVKSLGIPYGISESGIFSFDALLNYQYNPNGVQRIALKNGQNDQLAISPYSTYLTLPLDFQGAYDNILALEKVNCGGRYGYYECIDYTASRVGNNNFQIVRSYMAHHIGMSIIATCNALKSNIMQQRFMRDKLMSRATELLQEKSRIGDIVLFEQKSRENIKAEPPISEKAEFFGELFPSNPRVMLLNNGETSLVLTDIGVSTIFRHSGYLTMPTNDILRNSHAVFVYICTDSGVIPLTYAPYFEENVSYETSYSDCDMTYYAKNDKFSSKIITSLDQSASVERREITVNNLQKCMIDTTVIFEVEPCFLTSADAKYPEISFHLQNKNGELSHNNSKCIVNHCSSKNEKLDQKISIKIPLKLKAKESITFTVLSSLSLTEAEKKSNISAMNKLDYVSAKNIFKPNSIEQRIGQTVLSQLLYGKFDSRRNIEARMENVLSSYELQKFGISENIILVEAFDAENHQRISLYESIFKSIYFTGIKCNLVFLCDNIAIKNYVNATIFQKDFIGESIIIINKDELSDSEIVLLVAAARHIATRSLIRIETPLVKYIPMKIQQVLPISEMQSNSPACHMLNNGILRATLSSCSLGYTSATEPQGFMLTAGNVDSESGKICEYVLLRHRGEVFDLADGATTEFSTNSIIYRSTFACFSATMTITLSGNLAEKHIEVEIENHLADNADIEVCYYIQPVLGVYLVNSRYTVVNKYDEMLVVTNPDGFSGKYCMGISAMGDNFDYVCDRVDFFSGNWNKNLLNSTNDVCAAVCIKSRVNKTQKMNFSLALAEKIEDLCFSKDFINS